MTAKIALYGPPGAGKSTLATLLAQEAELQGINAITVKLAQPLYDLQQSIYERAGRPLRDTYRQDGKLLNSLGSHLQRINPEALTEDFARRVSNLLSRQASNQLLVCDDMRGNAVPTLTHLGFTLVQVSAPEQLRRQRKQNRADLTRGDDNHVTEVPVDREPDHRIVNDGSLDNLRALALDLIEQVQR
ncbi:AAA family ATPase [Nocardiopsis aegyptia]|uniref:AAA family ATPase n=1 Tax=Nocardiopsis aegyptia TaxID=220378 RepID=UPI00366C1265